MGVMGSYITKHFSPVSPVSGFKLKPMNPKCRFQLVSPFGFGFNRDFPGLKPLKPYETKMKVSMVSTVSK
jgi:hypothetical protein